MFRILFLSFTLMACLWTHLMCPSDKQPIEKARKGEERLEGDGVDLLTNRFK